MLHIRVKPTGIANLPGLEEAEVHLAEALLRALGVMQDPPTPVAIDEVVAGSEIL